VKISLPVGELEQTIHAQIRSFDSNVDATALRKAGTEALERVEYCFERIRIGGYRDASGATFNHLHGDQSATFLYFLAHSAYATLGDTRLASQAFVLNKMRNAIVVMYDTVLPRVFLLNHTVGTVLGKATYGEYFVAYQNATVGTDRGIRPVLGTGVVMYGGSTIVGRCTIGDRTAIAVNATVVATDVPADTVVSGQHPAVAFHPRKRDFLGHYFMLASAEEDDNAARKPPRS